MNVFVTGASGFIGRAVVRELLRARHSVTSLLLPTEPESPVAGTTVVRGDVTRGKTLAGVLRGADAIVHLAGAVGYQTWGRCLAVNRDGTANVVCEAVVSSVRRFVHMSSVAVYGRTPGVAIGEDFPRKKIGDPYGDTKIDAENIVLAMEREGKLDLTILRPTVVYGPGDDKFLPALLASLRGGKFRIIGDGTQRVDLIHVDDLAAAVRRALEDPRTIGRIYNLTNPDNPTWDEMVAAVSRELGIPAPRKHLPFRTAYRVAGIMEGLSRLTGKPPKLSRYSVRVVGRPYFYEVGAAQRELGFVPSVDLLTGLKACLKADTPGAAMK